MSHAVSGWYSTRSKIHSQRGRWKHRGRDTSLCECVRARVVYVCVREESLNVEYDEVINISLASAAGALGWNDPLRPRRSCNVVRTALHWQRAEWDKMKLKDELLKKKKKKKIPPVYVWLFKNIENVSNKDVEMSSVFFAVSLPADVQLEQFHNEEMMSLRQVLKVIDCESRQI